jgi:surfactin synthase thioesterase subunit
MFGRRRTGKRTLICFPHAGGGASFFRSLQDFLAPDIDVLAVQYPGHEDRLAEPLIETMEDLVNAIVKSILPIFDEPVALFGHSMGAIVAYEVTMRLEARGLLVRTLHVSAHPAPHRQRLATPPQTDDGYAYEITRLSGGALPVLDDEVFRDLFLPALRNDYQLLCNYRHQHQEKLQAPIVAFLAEDDTEASNNEMRAWREVTAGMFDLKIFSGGHFYLVSHVERLALILNRCFDSPTMPS